MEQRSNEWHEARRGKFTASEIVKLIGTGEKPSKYGPSLTDWTDTAQSYILSRVAQFFSMKDQKVDSMEMKWGRDYESLAIKTYEQSLGVTVAEEGFIRWHLNTNAGCSPDGLVVEENRGIEVKCPFQNWSHMEHLLIRNSAELKKAKPQYYWQVMSSLLFTGWDCWNFVSFHPFFNPDQRLYVIEIFPESLAFEMLTERIEAAVTVRNELINRILNK
jgi:putative phage-type endonuclease